MVGPVPEGCFKDGLDTIALLISRKQLFNMRQPGVDCMFLDLTGPGPEFDGEGEPVAVMVKRQSKFG